MTRSISMRYGDVVERSISSVLIVDQPRYRFLILSSLVYLYIALSVVTLRLVC